MSQTLRIYHREYGSGKVEMVGGWGMTSYSYVKHMLRNEVEKFASSLGSDVKPQEDKDGNIHVIRTVKHRAEGRYYFVASSPASIPLGEGWSLCGAFVDGRDMVFTCDLPSGETVFLTWTALSQDDIDNQHGNDEFGGWTDPTITTIGGVDPFYLNGLEGSADAVMLMMTDAKYVKSMALSLS